LTQAEVLEAQVVMRKEQLEGVETAESKSDASTKLIDFTVAKAKNNSFVLREGGGTHTEPIPPKTCGQRYRWLLYRGLACQFVTQETNV
jgi:hypothetical protein